MGGRSCFVALVFVMACSSDDSEPTTPPEVSAAASQAELAAQAVVLGDSVYGVTAAGPGKPLIVGAGDLGGCGAVSWVGSVVTIDFGPGCTMPNGVEVSGAISASLTDMPPTAHLGFDVFVVDGYDVDGTFDYGVPGVGQGRLMADLTLEADHWIVDLLTSHQEGSPFVITGGVDVNGSVITMTEVTIAAGTCLPNAGSITLGAYTVIFGPETPITGEVTVVLGEVMWTWAPMMPPMCAQLGP